MQVFGFSSFFMKKLICLSYVFDKNVNNAQEEVW
jgi:hypothetical protein